MDTGPPRDMDAFVPEASFVGCRRSIFLLLRIRAAARVLLVLCMASACCGMPDGIDEQIFARQPQDQSAVIHTRVTLPCRVINRHGVVQWTKDGFGLGSNRNLTGFERYHVIGSDEEGDFSLDIASVTLDDDGVFQCQVANDIHTDEPELLSREARLTVLVPPEPPKILQGNFLSTTEDREIELECISVGGRPAAEITWIDGNGKVITHGITPMTESLPDLMRQTARSILILTPKRDHHNHTYTCQAMNTADRTYKSAKISLEVKYAPKVTVSVVSGAAQHGRIPEGAEVRLSCQSDANPKEVSYRWLLNDEPVVGDYTTEMIIFNVTKNYHDAIVKCEVHNAVGKSEESETLDVSYGPRFRSRPSSMQADFGKTVALSCDVDGNPPADITWLHQDLDRLSVVGSTPNLTLMVDSSTSGRYICKAAVQGYPEIEAEANILVKGPPHVVSHQIQFGVEGDHVRMECVAYSVPKPEHVIWTFNGREINAVSDQDFTIVEDPTYEGIKSTLIVRDSQSRHIGTFNCSVTNEYGTDSEAIILAPQRTFPLVLILSAAGGGIVLIAALAMLLIICQRRRRKEDISNTVAKKPDVMSDHLGNGGNVDRHCKESDRSSNISDLKLELRQADGGCELDYSGSDAAIHSTNLHIPLSKYDVGLPLPMHIPNHEHASALMMQYARYSNDYSDQAFPMTMFKDGHNNNGYMPYVDYSRDYAPPPLNTSMESNNRPQLSSLHSSNQLNAQLNQLNAHLTNLNSAGSSKNGSLTRSIDTVSTAQFNSGNPSLNNSLQRTIGVGAKPNGTDSSGTLNSLGLPPIGNGSAIDDVVRNHHVALYATTQGSTTKPNSALQGVDVRYAATYGNPYLRTGGLGSMGQVNTANPSVTPAPPPYSSVRKPKVEFSSQPPGIPQSQSSTLSPQSAVHFPNAAGIATAVTTSPNGSAQPQVARAVPVHGHLSPDSQYILPPNGQGQPKPNVTNIARKGSKPLATHV